MSCCRKIWTFFDKRRGSQSLYGKPKGPHPTVGGGLFCREDAGEPALRFFLMTLFYGSDSAFPERILCEKEIALVSLSGMPSSPIWATEIWSPSSKDRSGPLMALAETNSVSTGSPLIQIRLYGEPYKALNCRKAFL